jgi:hypothetical protein
VTLLSLAASVFAVSSTKIHSAISQPRLALKPYCQLVHGLNSLLVWFQRRVGLADGAVCDNITPCPIGAKKVGLMGAIFTSSKHLSVPPWQKSIVRMHRLDVVLRRVRHRHHIGCCLCSSAKISVQCVDDASYTKQPNEHY